MPKRDDFIAYIKNIKGVWQNINEDEFKKIVDQSTEYGLSPAEAEKILIDEGLTVGGKYFEVLELSIDELKNLSETEAEERIKRTCKALFRSLRNSQNPRKQKQLREVSEARTILIDEGKLQQYIIEYKKDNTGDTDADDDDRNKRSSGENARTIIKFRNGDEATSISQLATLMEKNTSEATDFLYQDYLEQSLAGAGETPFAIAAKAVASHFSSDHTLGLMAMVAILREKIKFKRGGEAGTPQQLARLIDKNWEEAKTFLYNGFFEFWFEYSTKTKLASIANKITTTFPNDEDIGLEEFVQKLDPQIGKPKLQLNQTKVDFGIMDTKARKTIDIQITNRGRGFLYGNVQLTTGIPELQISDTEIRDEGVVSVQLDASQLLANKTHQTALVFNTNGGMMRLPVSCSVIPKAISDVNTKDADGNTSLHLAARAGDHKQVEMLLSHGAEVNAKGKWDSPPYT